VTGTNALNKAALRCFCAQKFTPIPGAAAGPLSKLSFAVKDLIDTAGSITGAGNPDWMRTHAAAGANSSCIQKLLDAGASVAGRTITDELAFSLEGENYFEGTPINPSAPDRLPGGSSSGSAVAVAGSLVDFALGTDTGGSVRVPAAFCGIYGFRPTHGAVSTDGVVPFAPSLDTVGWFARDAATLLRVGSVLLPNIRRGPILQILIARDAFALADQDISTILISALQRLGVPLRTVDGAPFLIKEVAKCYQHVQAADIVTAQGKWLKETKPVFGPNIAPRFAGIWASSPKEIAEARSARDRLSQHLRSLFQAHAGAAIALPSAPCFALKQGLDPSELGEFYARALAIGGLASLGALPQISIPVGSEALKAGLGLIGAPGSDLDLLKYSLTLDDSLS
jgi:amidase